MHMHVKHQNKMGRRVVLACLICIIVACALSGCSFFSSSEPTVTQLDIVAEVTKDGDLLLTETHKLSFPDRGRDWWNYNRVVDLSFEGESNGQQQIPTDDDQYKMWVDDVEYPLYGTANLDSYNAEYWQKKIGNGAYYYKSSGKTELGVVMPQFEKGQHTVKFQYKVTNVLLNYQDVYGLYYQFIPAGNTMDITAMTVKIAFPKSAEAKTFAWLHLSTGGGGVELSKADDGAIVGVNIEAEDVPAGVFVETRLTLDKTAFLTNDKLVSKPQTLQQIKAEEQKWFDDFQAELKRASIMAGVDIGVAVAAVVVSILLTILFLHKKRPPKVDDGIEYVRDIPTDWSAEQGSHLYGYYQNGKHTEDRMSATILNLARKKYLEIKPGEKKRQAEITVVKTDKSDLKDFEGIVLGLLEQVSPEGKPFTMQDFERWSKQRASYVASQIATYESATRRRAAEGGYLQANTKPDKIATSVAAGFGVLGAILLANAFLMLITAVNLTFAGLGLIAGALILLIVKRKKAPLLLKGQKQHAYFNALAKYMTDFSNLKEHEIPALVLWEEYMVWATAMGIADKVAEQLEIAYPEYREMVTTGYCNNTFLLLYLLSPRLRFSSGLNLVSNVANVMTTVHSVQRAERAAAMAHKFGSSGGGGRGGGGFGGGGGGFGGGGSMGSR